MDSVFYLHLYLCIFFTKMQTPSFFWRKEYWKGLCVSLNPSLNGPLIEENPQIPQYSSFIYWHQPLSLSLSLPHFRSPETDFPLFQGLISLLCNNRFRFLVVCCLTIPGMFLAQPTYHMCFFFLLRISWFKSTTCLVLQKKDVLFLSRHCCLF